MIAAPADIMASPKGTLIIHYGDTAVQYSLEGIEADLENSSDGTSRIDLWAHVAGENFVDLVPEVKTVADLTLRHVGTTRVRITTRDGVHEGHLDNLGVDSVELYHSLQRTRLGRRLHAELRVGGADFIASDTDLAEVIEEEYTA